LDGTIADARDIRGLRRDDDRLLPARSVQRQGGGERRPGDDSLKPPVGCCSDKMPARSKGRFIPMPFDALRDRPPWREESQRRQGALRRSIIAIGARVQPRMTLVADPNAPHPSEVPIAVIKRLANPMTLSGGSVVLIRVDRRRRRRRRSWRGVNGLRMRIRQGADRQAAEHAGRERRIPASIPAAVAGKRDATGGERGESSDQQNGRLSMEQKHYVLSLSMAAYRKRDAVTMTLILGKLSKNGPVGPAGAEFANGAHKRWRVGQADKPAVIVKRRRSQQVHGMGMVRSDDSTSGQPRIQTLRTHPVISK
jgi:hypothetical protein